MTTANRLQAATGGHESWAPLLELAAREVFELMLGCRLTILTTESELSLNITPNVTSMVGMAGELCGVLSVRCQTDAAALMTSKMLGVELDKIVLDMSDAVGEITNMIAGNFKNKIAGLGDGCMLSPPTVVIGSDYSVHSLGHSPALEIRMLFENMPIVISLQINA